MSGTDQKGGSSMKCCKKAARFPHLQLVRVVYEASGTHHNWMVTVGDQSLSRNRTISASKLEYTPQCILKRENKRLTKTKKDGGISISDRKINISLWCLTWKQLS